MLSLFSVNTTSPRNPSRTAKHSVAKVGQRDPIHQPLYRRNTMSSCPVAPSRRLASKKGEPLPSETVDFSNGKIHQWPICCAQRTRQLTVQCHYPSKSHLCITHENIVPWVRYWQAPPSSISPSTMHPRPSVKIPPTVGRSGAKMLHLLAAPCNLTSCSWQIPTDLNQTLALLMAHVYKVKISLDRYRVTIADTRCTWLHRGREVEEGPLTEFALQLIIRGSEAHMENTLPAELWKWNGDLHSCEIKALLAISGDIVSFQTNTHRSWGLGSPRTELGDPSTDHPLGDLRQRILVHLKPLAQALPVWEQ